MKKRSRQNGHDVGIIILFEEERPVPGKSFPAVPVYACPVEAWPSGLMALDQKRGSWEAAHFTEIEAPYILFLEETERLTKKQARQIAGIIGKRRVTAAELYVRRFAPVEYMSGFSWVPTYDFFDEAHPDLTDYYTTELRLISRLLLPDALTLAHHPGGQPCFTIRLSEEAGVIPRLEMTITGKLPAPLAKEEAAFTDEDVFTKGHERYFHDKKYSEAFEWPYEGYNTLRFEHIPSILQGLREGLSSPLPTQYALVYLLRFRDFETAWEMASLIPEKWLTDNPDLATTVTAVGFALKKYETARSLMLQAVERYPENPGLAHNAVKTMILTDDPEGAARIERIHLNATGRPLEDSLLERYRSSHGGIPEKTATISFCTIVRDESESLGTCLASVSDLVDEIIIVDTGSQDDTVAVAEQYGARVIHAPWEDDFSVARNIALSHAGCDYVLVLDADEYLSPFLYLESHALKKLLPLATPRAFQVPIGYYFIDTHWYSRLSQQGNFRRETEDVRLFPRIPGIKYHGRIRESVEPYLKSRDIPIVGLPEASLHILHDRQWRESRIKRKAHIYRMVRDPDLKTVLSAIQDHSRLGDTTETLYWIERYTTHEDADPEDKKRMGMHMARILASGNAKAAEPLYKDLINLYPDDPEIPLALAALYVSRGNIGKIEHIPFPDLDTDHAGPFEARLAPYIILRQFISGDVSGAWSHIEETGNRFRDKPLFLAVESYMLLAEKRIEEALYPISGIHRLTKKQVHRELDSLEDFLTVVEELCHHLDTKGLYEERALLLAGALSLGE